MAQTVVVQLIDDIDGGDADETVSFALDGKAYEIELSRKNAAILRKMLAPYIEKGRTAGRPSSPSAGTVLRISTENSRDQDIAL